MALAFPAPADADAAVVLACDDRYLPFALHLARQIVLAHPGRDFDILIASETPLNLPSWAVEAGVGNPVPANFARAGSLALHHLQYSTYLRLFLPELLAARYKRLLYLDSDIFLEAGGLDRLLRLPLGDHAFGAVQDVIGMLNPGDHAPEYRAIGEPAHMYFNSGVLLIETASWVAQGILERCLKLGADKPQVQVKHDQSLLNGVMLGRFAELSPVWNWMLNQTFPFLTRGFPVRMRHFIGAVKPWGDPKGRHDARYRSAYADFFALGLATTVPRMDVPAPGLRRMPLQRMAQHVLLEQRHGKRLVSELGRFRDAWDVKLTAGAR